MSAIFVAVACLLLCVPLVRWVQKGSIRSRPQIRINGGRVVEVAGGRSLFHVLASEGIALPSTCGGKGSCAKCRCRVLQGGGAITAQERPYFSKAEVDAGWRLACQVQVHGDIAVDLPE